MAYRNTTEIQGETPARPWQITSCEQWSRRYSWVARVQAWDDWLDAKAREAHIEAAQAMGRRHVQAAQGLLGLAARKLAEMSQSGRPMSWGEVRRYLTDAIKLERLIRGVGPGAGLQHSRPSSELPVGDGAEKVIQQFDLTALSDGESATLARLLRKMLVRVESVEPGVHCRESF